MAGNTPIAARTLHLVILVFFFFFLEVFGRVKSFVDDELQTHGPRLEMASVYGLTNIVSIKARTNCVPHL